MACSPRKSCFGGHFTDHDARICAFFIPAATGEDARGAGLKTYILYKGHCHCCAWFKNCCFGYRLSDMPASD